MSKKMLNTRIQHKHDVEANWLKATNFIPMLGELIIYDVDSTHTAPRFKVGDGKTVVSSLPFSDANKLDTARTISLTGDVTGSASFDGSKDVSITATVTNSSHNHSASNITSGTLPITRGGTGATTAATALTNFGITSTAAELNILDGVTATAAEINKLDGLTATTTELNYVDGVTSNIQTQLNGKAASSHGTHVTYSTTAPVVAGTASVGTATTVSRSDHVHPAQTTVSGNAGSATKLQNGRTLKVNLASTNASTAFNGTANISDIGVSGTLPIANGGTGATTAAAALTNLGITSTAAELNILDGVTATAAEINKLDGLTATTAELNYVDGVTSSIQTQLGGKAPTSHASTATTYGVSTASNYGHAMASSTTPKANGTAAVGSETAKFARGDHVHPLQTSVSGNAGTATKLATMRYIDGIPFNGSSNITHYAICSTDSATAEKVVFTIAGTFSLIMGAKVTIKFTYANNVASPTLNVESTGAKPIFWHGAALPAAQYWAGGSTLDFVYNGTQWELIGIAKDNNTIYSNVSLGQGYGTCSTEAATVEKVATLSNYTLATGGIVAIKFTNAVPASAKLNINSRGAKAIYYRDAAITDGVINAGDTATFIYANSRYHLLAVDRVITSNIFSLSGTTLYITSQ